MKRDIKKPLALSRETLRSLKTDSLPDAKGAASARTLLNMICTQICTGGGCLPAWSLGCG